MAYTQDGRPLQVATALEKDVLLLQHFEARESMSELFRIRLTMLSEKPDLELTKIIGTNMTAAVGTGEAWRYFNGYVRTIRQAETTLDLTTYEAELVPWLWFLTQTRDCRIFHEMTVPDIIEKVFELHGFKGYEKKLQATYRERVMVVQYRETAFDFISRLMEEEGIYYYFTHADGEHKMVLGDDPSGCVPVPEHAKVVFNPGEGTIRGEEHVNAVNLQSRVRSTKVALRDFFYETPNEDLNVQREAELESLKLPVYDYPGGYTKAGEGKHYAQVRMEAAAAPQDVLRGKGDCRNFSAGYRFRLEEHPHAAMKKEWLLVEVLHKASLAEGAYRSGVQKTADSGYENRFVCIPHETPFRPARRTPLPVIGTQTAIVVGPSGEEIHTDKFGRIKIQFHWDRIAKLDDKASCWVRVAQLMAGKKWGFIHLPRIGQEVVVEFEEGNPDRPIVTGCVYNGEAMPPFELPGNKTMSGMVSRSSKDAKGENITIIRVEDKKGEEQLFIQAEKNEDIRVKNDCYEWVGNDRHLVVENDQVETVNNDRSETVERDHKETIGRDRNLKVEGKESIEVTKSRSVVVTGDVTEEFKKNHSEVVTDDYYLKATNICIEGTENVTVKVGGSYVAIDSSGVKIGTDGDIVLEASGDVEVSGSNVKVTGQSQVEVSGSSMVKVSGGTIKLN